VIGPARIILKTNGVERLAMDMQLMEHILTNIMSNALKYSPDEKIKN
jgi:signal transduction histidine kinase